MSNMGPEVDLLNKIKVDYWHFLAREGLETPPSSRSFAFSRLVESIVKKYTGDATTTPEGDAAALSKFLASNERARDWAWVQTDRVSAMVDETIKLTLFRWLGDVTLGCVFEHWGLGPGASRGCRTNDVYTKLFDSPMTGSSRSLYIRYLHSLRTASQHEAERSRAEQHGDFRLTVASSASFARKTAKESRMITTEPLLNMLAQKSLGWYVERSLARNVGIKLDAQPMKNRRLAKLGSMLGCYATIDLSDASNYALRLAEVFFPEGFYRAMEATRTAFVQIGKDQVPMHVLSGMGNGFTFQVETMLFAAIVHSCYHVLGIRDEEGINVFGDDIICRTEAVPLVVETLQRLGFRINSDKSFTSGPFRESCGGDYIDGEPCKPVYVRSLTDHMHIYSAINRLYVWAEIHAHVDSIRSTLKWLVSLLDPEHKVLVPFDMPVDSGIYAHGVANTAPIWEYDYFVRKARKGPKTGGHNPAGAFLAAVYGATPNHGGGLAAHPKLVVTKPKRKRSFIDSTWAAGLSYANSPFAKDYFATSVPVSTTDWAHFRLDQNMAGSSSLDVDSA